MKSLEVASAAISSDAVDRRVDLLRLMVLGRELERVVGRLDHHWHASLGEEAVIVGSLAALEDIDVAIPHYRGALIAALVRGSEPRTLIAGVLGKATGPTRGRWRGDVTGEVRPNQFGSFSGSLGPSLSYAAGAALAAKRRRSGGVSLVLFGDGTINSGLFHESLNLASMLRLPAIFVCQNNQYAISTPARVAIPGTVLKRGEGYGVVAVQVDGNDVLAVHQAVRAAANRGRAGEGPTFIDALTYRASGHWVSDPSAYRDPDELRAWTARDPIQLFARQLVAEGAIIEGDVAGMTREAATQIEAALAQALADPWPDASVLAGNVYAPD
jgi:TPP-dependent pyruvate/acetoin dehydrogenase alpha subunit